MVKANVDIILDYLKVKKTASVPDIAKATKIPVEAVQKSVEYLEEDGILKIDYKLTTPYVYLIQKNESQKQNIEKPLVKQTPMQNVQLKETPITFTEPIEKPREDTKPFKDAIELNLNLNFSGESQKFNAENQQGVQNPKIEQNLPPSISNSDTLVAKPVDKNLFGENEAVQEIHKKEIYETEIIDKNPLDEKPSFELNPPIPGNVSENKQGISEKPFIKPVLAYTSEFSNVQIDVPEYIETDAQKIDFLIEYCQKKLENYDYNGLNSLYRDIYNIFKDSIELSPNERFLIGEKINDLFQRIKRIYLIEEAV